MAKTALISINNENDGPQMLKEAAQTQRYFTKQANPILRQDFSSEARSMNRGESHKGAPFGVGD